MSNAPDLDAKAISLKLQDLAKGIHDILAEQVGKPVNFALVVNINHSVQYVSNVDRRDGIELIESLLKAWKQDRADIPLHYGAQQAEP